MLVTDYQNIAYLRRDYHRRIKKDFIEHYKYVLTPQIRDAFWGYLYHRERYSTHFWSDIYGVFFIITLNLGFFTRQEANFLVFRYVCLSTYVPVPAWRGLFHNLSKLNLKHSSTEVSVQVSISRNAYLSINVFESDLPDSLKTESWHPDFQILLSRYGWVVMPFSGYYQSTVFEPRRHPDIE